MNENEEFEFRARAEAEKPMGGGKPPLGFVAKQIWGIAPQNPKNVLQNLPIALGALGGAAPLVGGAFLGTGAGQAARYAGAKAFNQPVPSGLQHAGELGGAALADVMAIPAIKKNIFGKQIGAAEKAAGVVTRAPDRLPTSGNVGQILGELETALTKGAPGPQSARDAYGIANYVNQNPNLVGKSNEISVQAARVRKLAQAALNNQVPGRGGAAAGMAQAMTIPRAIGNAYQTIPQPIRRGMGFGAGAVGAGEIMAHLLKRLLGG